MPRGSRSGGSRRNRRQTAVPDAAGGEWKLIDLDASTRARALYFGQAGEKDVDLRMVPGYQGFIPKARDAFGTSVYTKGR